MSDSLWLHRLLHTRLPCSSPTPRACSNSCPLSQWCNPTISSSVTPFSFCLHLPQHQCLFQWVCSSHQVAKVLEFQLQHQSFQWIFRTDFLEDWLVWSPGSPRDSQEGELERDSQVGEGLFPTPQFKSINSLALSLLYAPSFLFSLTTLFSYPLTTFKLFKKSCLHSVFQFPIQSNYLGNYYNVCTPTIE